MTNKKTIRLVIGVVCWLIAAYLAYSMYQLAAQEILWKQQPLWFWLLLWGGFLAFVGKRYVAHEKSVQLLAASSLSGFLLAGGFMPMPTFFLMFVAFVPLLWAENEVAKTTEGTDQWAIFKLAFNAFLIWNLLSTWWIQNSSFIGGIIGNALNAVFMCVPFLLYHITKRHMGQRAANLGFVAYWMTFELGHLNWDLSWPWLTLGNSFAHLPIMVQWYEFTGVFGGGLWILWLNIALANRVLPIGKRRYELRSWVTWSKPLAGVLVPILVSVLLYYLHDSRDGKAAEVVTIQPNYEPHYKKFKTPRREQFAQFIRLSESQLTDTTAYLVFPETSFWAGEVEGLEQAPIIERLRAFLQLYPTTQLITGLNTRTNLKEYHNSAIQLNARQEKIPYYIKSKLVPGAEIMPYIGNIELFKNLILDLGGIAGLSLGRQNNRAVFQSANGAIGPLICYESIYGGYVTDYVKEGAQALFVMTNDGWWGNTLGHRQHHYLSKLRAIETRRYVVRSANTGISCFINSRGDTYQASNYEEPAALRDTIYMRDGQTFYVQYGNLLGRVSIIVSIWLVISMLSNSLRGKSREGEL